MYLNFAATLFLFDHSRSRFYFNSSKQTRSNENAQIRLYSSFWLLDVLSSCILRVHDILSSGSVITFACRFAISFYGGFVIILCGRFVITLDRRFVTIHDIVSLRWLLVSTEANTFQSILNPWNLSNTKLIKYRRI
jgi:hypothetical protein